VNGLASLLDGEKIPLHLNLAGIVVARLYIAAGTNIGWIELVINVRLPSNGVQSMWSGGLLVLALNTQTNTEQERDAHCCPQDDEWDIAPVNGIPLEHTPVYLWP